MIDKKGYCENKFKEYQELKKKMDGEERKWKKGNVNMSEIVSIATPADMQKFNETVKNLEGCSEYLTDEQLIEISGDYNRPGCKTLSKEASAVLSKKKTKIKT